MVLVCWFVVLTRGWGRFRNEASSCTGIFSRTLRFQVYYFTSRSPPGLCSGGHLIIGFGFFRSFFGQFYFSEFPTHRKQWLKLRTMPLLGRVCQVKFIWLSFSSRICLPLSVAKSLSLSLSGYIYMGAPLAFVRFCGSLTPCTRLSTRSSRYWAEFFMFWQGCGLKLATRSLFKSSGFVFCVYMTAMNIISESWFMRHVYMHIMSWRTLSKSCHGVTALYTAASSTASITRTYPEIRFIW